MQINSQGNIIRDIEIANDKIISVKLTNAITSRTYDIKGVEFAISYFEKSGLFQKPILFDSNDATIAEYGEDWILFTHKTNGIDWKIKVNYRVVDAVIKKNISINCSSDNVVIDYIDIDSFDTSFAKFKWTIPIPTKRVYTPSYITTEGQPFYVEDMFFGAEFPVADNRIIDNTTMARYHIGRPFGNIKNGNTYTTVDFVMGAGIGSRFDMMRSSFFKYVDTFARPAKFRVQFNSWYDNMLDIDSTKIADSFLAVAANFHKVGYRPLDCYVVDDGWIDYKTPTFWEFDTKKFPKKFTLEKELTKKLNSTFGVWFGPRGGYTTETIKYAHRLEKIGYHVCKQSHDICTCDPKYIHDLCDRMADFCKDYNVTYFKIDGFAITPCHSKHHGHPVGRGDGLYFYTFLWEEWIRGFEHIRSVCPDVFLNITSYAHCSPWFLKWCDAVWINNCGDMGYDGSGSNLNQCLCYRDNKYMDFFEKRELQFPTAYIYNHEPCYAERNYNPPLPNPSHKTVIYTHEEFEEYMYMCMMRGTGFVELYFSPSMFDEERWQIAADVLTWAEKNFDILKNSQFYGDDPSKDGTYGYYAYKDGEAIMSIRNASNEPKVYKLINSEHCYDNSAYTITQYYRIQGESKHVAEGEAYEISLAPYESRIYTIKLDK